MLRTSSLVSLTSGSPQLCCLSDVHGQLSLLMQVVQDREGASLLYPYHLKADEEWGQLSNTQTIRARSHKLKLPESQLTHAT